MFFRRRAPKTITFADRLADLRAAGFELDQPAGGPVTVRKNGCAAIVRDAAGQPRVESIGVLLGPDMARLVDGGFQKFLETPAGGRKPALASELKALHDFQEDLREALGLESYYNESLGTIFDLHNYDRLSGRP
jgi:hypothetical protein